MDTQTVKRPGTVLIADDDREVLKFLAERCALAGLQVHTASNGLQALLVAKRVAPDALIADVNMPEMDGLSVCSRLLGPDGKSMEVVVITGGSNEETSDRCESFGAYYVHKGPALWTEVRAALAEIFPGLASEPAQEPAQFAPTKLRSRPLVLLIDDDAEIALFLSSRLRKCGLDMLYAPDGAQGYRVACREKPSVIISDCFMQNGDASYLLSRLRGNAATERIPVFIITARPVEQARECLKIANVAEHLAPVQIFQKSFDASALFGALQKVCAFGSDQKIAGDRRQKAVGASA